ncbi:hypothetical protein JNL27_15995 [bacterium]|nr:hypothetical protein [bacterium]
MTTNMFFRIIRLFDYIFAILMAVVAVVFFKGCIDEYHTDKFIAVTLFMMLILPGLGLTIYFLLFSARNMFNEEIKKKVWRYQTLGNLILIFIMTAVLLGFFNDLESMLKYNSALLVFSYIVLIGAVDIYLITTTAIVYFKYISNDGHVG